MIDGSSVRYVGEDTMVGVGTLGKVLSSAPTATHVKWVEGSRQDQVDLVANEDLVPYEVPTEAPRLASAEFEDSLDMPSLITVAVRDVYDDQGEEGLITALDEAGHMATLSQHASDVIALVASRLRQDPAFSLVLGQLDEYEAESLLSRVAVSLLKKEDD